MLVMRVNQRQVIWNKMRSYEPIQSQTLKVLFNDSLHTKNEFLLISSTLIENHSKFD